MKWRFVVPLALLGFGVGLIVITALSTVMVVPSSESADNPVLEFVGMCLISPLIETTVLLFFFSMLRRFFSLKVSAIAAAIILSSGHALIWVWWPLVITPVLIMSSVPFMAENSSNTLRAIQSFIIHSVNNLMAWAMAYGFFVN